MRSIGTTYCDDCRESFFLVISITGLNRPNIGKDDEPDS
jgi:hypothetical protein